MGQSLDVIVLSKDRPDLFAACLAHLETQGVDYQGWLVDNGTDTSTASTAEGSGWNVISPGHNTGFAEGNNLGINASSGERVLLINNDAFLHPGALAAMLAHDDGIVASVNVKANGLVNFAGGVFDEGKPLHEGRRTHPSEHRCHDTEWVTFACVLIQRALLEDVGPLCEQYWYGFEDVDYCLSARQKGWSMSVCADAICTHEESATKGYGKGWTANFARFRERWPHDSICLVPA